jgi:hypothetical protein
MRKITGKILTYDTEFNGILKDGKNIYNVPNVIYNETVEVDVDAKPLRVKILEKSDKRVTPPCERVAVFIFCIVLGIPSSLGFGIWDFVNVAGLSILDMFDFVSNSVLMPIVAILTCIFIGYVIKPKALIEEIEIGAPFKAKTLFTVIIKYVAPICIVLILLSSVLDVLGVMKI